MGPVNILTAPGAEGHTTSSQSVQSFTGPEPLFTTKSLHLGRDVRSYRDRCPHPTML